MWIYVLGVIASIHSDVLEAPECIVEASDKAQRVAKALKEILVLRVVTSSEKKQLQRIVLVMFTPASSRPGFKTQKSVPAMEDEAPVEIRSKIVKQPKKELAVDPSASSTDNVARVEIRSKIGKKAKKELVVDPSASSTDVAKPKRKEIDAGFVPVAKILKKNRQIVAVTSTVSGSRSAGAKDPPTSLDTADDVRVPRVPRAQQFAQQAFANLLPTGPARSAANVDGKLVHSHRDPSKAAFALDASAPNIRRFDDMKKKVYAPLTAGQSAPRSVYRGPTAASSQRAKRRVSFGGSPAFAAYDDCVTEVVEINSKEADNPLKNVVDVLSPDVPAEFSDAVARRAGRVSRRMFFSALGGILSNIGAQRAAKEGLPFSEPTRYFAGHMPPPPDAAE
jgi:hypothetical protein